MKRNVFFTGLLSAAVGAAAALMVARVNVGSEQGGAPVFSYPSLLTSQNSTVAGAIDFTEAAEKTVHAVVHVKTSYAQMQQQLSPFEYFFGFRYQQPQQPVQGAGSGVILSSDGYIVTNNHVIDRAEKIDVTLNDKRTFAAKLIGADPSTDVAVLKIEAKELPYIAMGNSDALRLGEWVLAVGNPLNLTSTVTAGIVSAKARNINILSDNFKIESFIQTDAAVNPGNSGGALVNTRGELVGINTAIASPTGSYSGYSFAVPSSIVNKVATDIIEFGVVQRAVLGVALDELTSETAARYSISEVKGVLVQGVREGSAAEAAKLQKGDVVLKVNDAEVNTVAQLQEQISKFRPNDQVSLTVNRNNKITYVNVILRNRAGSTDLVKPDEGMTLNLLGVTLGEVDASARRSLQLRAGVQVKEVKAGKLASQGVKAGYIITRINRVAVGSPADVSRALSAAGSEAVLVEGIYPNGVVAYYAIGM
jgi:Do/DeqQ family serine protease